jgi:hypothetical protein
VKKNIEPKKQFNVGKEKEILKEEREDIFKRDVASTSTVKHTQNLPMYEMSSSMDHTSEAQPVQQVSNIKTFLQYCVKLLNDPSSIKVLKNILERCNTEVEGKLE